ncbi:MAG: helix-turn-helix transcriptional regulator [Oscillospiraceae bacterium]|nr:helix-turn-helix transcriptional regulator [Oscillospiraceae bacterium]
MNTQELSKESFRADSFSVAYAERRKVGEEWNLVAWNRKHRDIDCHRLYFRVDRGGGTARLRLTDGELELLPGNVYFIPAFSVLQSGISGWMEKYYIHFRSDSPVLSLYRHLSGKYCVPADELTEPLFRTVVENYTKSTQDACMRVRGAMDLLLSPFLADVSQERQSLLRFSPVLSYIEAHYREELSVSDLAAQMNLSTVYFSNAFKAAFHITPKQYVLNKRLTESRQLLLETDLSVKEIAYAVGFANESYFSELFTARTGVSATRFRQRALPEKRASIL